MAKKKQCDDFLTEMGYEGTLILHLVISCLVPVDSPPSTGAGATTGVLGSDLAIDLQVEAPRVVLVCAPSTDVITALVDLEVVVPFARFHPIRRIASKTVAIQIWNGSRNALR